MADNLSKQELEDFKKLLIQSLYDLPQVKQEVMDTVPDFLKPYAQINPFASDASEQIETVTKIMHPETVCSHPAWIQKLMDKGLIDTDGKTVIARSLEAVAIEITKQNIQVTNIMLRKFINGKTNRHYSEQSINLAVEYANAK